MIFGVLAVAVIVMAFVVPSLMVSLHIRSRARARQSSGPDFTWWPAFERDFRNYVRRLERERRQGQSHSHYAD